MPPGRLARGRADPGAAADVLASNWSFVVDRGAHDVAYFLSQSLATETRRSCESQLIERNAEGPAEHGIDNPEMSYGATTGSPRRGASPTRQLAPVGSTLPLEDQVRPAPASRAPPAGRFDRCHKRCNPERVGEVSEQALIGQVVERLARKYPTVPQENVATVVAHSRFDGSKLRDCVPLLVERRAKVQLAKLWADLIDAPVTEAV